MPIVPPKTPSPLRSKPNVTIRMSADILEKLDLVAEQTGNSRSMVVNHLLTWALSAYEKEQQDKSKPQT